MPNLRWGQVNGRGTMHRWRYVETMSRHDTPVWKSDCGRSNTKVTRQRTEAKVCKRCLAAAKRETDEVAAVLWEIMSVIEP